MTKSSNYLSGGYILVPKCLDESVFARCAPCAREVFLWLMRNVNFCDYHSIGNMIRRGQILTSAPKIREEIKWRVGVRTERYTEDQIRTAINTLRRQGMITTTKTTRGMIITVCDYDKYQNAKSYEAPKQSQSERHTETVSKTPEGQMINNKEKKYKKPMSNFRVSDRASMKDEVIPESYRRLQESCYPSVNINNAWPKYKKRQQVSNNIESIDEWENWLRQY